MGLKREWWICLSYGGVCEKVVGWEYTFGDRDISMQRAIELFLTIELLPTGSYSFTCNLFLQIHWSWSLLPA